MAVNMLFLKTFDTV